MVCMQDARKRPSISGSQVLLLLCVYRCSHRDLSPMQYQAPCSWSSGMVSWWAKVCVLSSWQGTICNRTVDLIIPPPPYLLVLIIFVYSPNFLLFSRQFSPLHLSPLPIPKKHRRDDGKTGGTGIPRKGRSWRNHLLRWQVLYLSQISTLPAAPDFLLICVLSVSYVSHSGFPAIGDASGFKESHPQTGELGGNFSLANVFFPLE